MAAVLALQASVGNRAVARLLKVSGGAPDWGKFRAIAEPAASTAFARDAKGVVSGSTYTPPKAAAAPAGPTKLAPGQAPSLTPPSPSPAFQSRLLGIVNDKTRDAEVHLGQGQPDVFLGAFPQKPPPPGGPQPLVAPSKEQRIDIDDVDNTERWAPGHGVAKLLHEVVENYEGHDSGFDYGKAHDAGIEAEVAVVKDFAGSGAGRGGVASGNDPGQPGVTLWAFDYISHFLVVEVAADASVQRARKVAPKVVKTVLTNECEAGKEFVDYSMNVKPLMDAQLAWGTTDLATVRFAGRTDPADAKAGAGTDLGVRRAQAALKALNAVSKIASKRTTNLFEQGEVAATASGAPGRQVEISVVVPAL